MKTWNNGDNGAVVKKVIDENFDVLEKRIDMLSFVYVKSFTTSDWVSGTITINHAEYNKLNPLVELYMKNGSEYCEVLGGYSVVDSGVVLKSDMAYEGKVVIR